MDKLKVKRTKRTFSPDDSRTWKRLLSLGQVAEITGLSRHTIRRWADNGQLPMIKRSKGGHRFFSKNQILKLKENFINPEIVTREFWERLERKMLKKYKARLKNLFDIEWEDTSKDFQQSILCWIERQIQVDLKYINYNDRGFIAEA